MRWISQAPTAVDEILRLISFAQDDGAKRAGQRVTSRRVLTVILRSRSEAQDLAQASGVVLSSGRAH